jgi:putative methionine-R-sulfoxide reductase with GAF domain
MEEEGCTHALKDAEQNDCNFLESVQAAKNPILEKTDWFELYCTRHKSMKCKGFTGIQGCREKLDRSIVETLHVEPSTFN